MKPVISKFISDQLDLIVFHYTSIPFRTRTKVEVDKINHLSPSCTLKPCVQRFNIKGQNDNT